jgi:hypothetical protein
MSGMRLFLASARGEFEKGFAEMHRPIFEAGDKAMKEVKDDAKKAGRAEMVRAKFSPRFANALRTRTYKDKEAGRSIAAGFLWVRSAWIGAHEDGANIAGKPLLWLPLRGTPKRRGKPIKPADVPGKLFTIPGAKPMLAARVRVAKSQATAREPKVTMAALNRGDAPGRGVLRSVPLFIGIRSVTLPKRMDVTGAIERVTNRLPELYVKHLRPDG